MYVITVNNSLKYVGVTSNFGQRIRGHKSYSKTAPRLLVHRAMAKHSWSVEVAGEFDTRGVALSEEASLISKLGCQFPHGLNITPGGNVPPNKGKLSPLRGRKRPPFSEEWRKNIGKSTVGRRGYWAGKKRSAETIRKMSASRVGVSNTAIKRPVIDDSGTVYDSATDAAKELNLNRSLIVAVLSGRRNKTGNKSFKYLEDK